MRIWIDIANAPHATLFDPLGQELQERGAELFVTVWDRGQTGSLARSYWPDAVPIGASFQKSVLRKGLALLERAAQLQRAVGSNRVDVALGHNSYSQLVAARWLRIPAITMMDYEHQPANHLAFRFAHRIFLPEAISPSAVRRFGARQSKICWYGGLKEDVTLARFQPVTNFRSEVLRVPSDRVLVLMRPPASGALYHRHGNPIFDQLVRRIRHLPQASVLVSPRTSSQGDYYEKEFGVRVLREPVSGPDLLYSSDLVIGAGGTMSREAAVIGTPVISVFAGKPASVDQQLVREGRLTLLQSIDDFRDDAVSPVEGRHWEPKSGSIHSIAAQLLEAARELHRGRVVPTGG